MKLSEFDYELPDGLVAQQPCEERDGARLLVHERASGRTEHRRVAELDRLLRAGDLLVVNDTRVLPSRLHGRRASGGAVELLLLEPGSRPGAWRALVNPARKLKPGEVVELEGGVLRARMLERPTGPDGAPQAAWEVELEASERGDAADVETLLEAHGHVPLPPYIHRSPDDPRESVDRERYQTVYAAHPGAVAAPTAGLHFTPELLARLDARGVRRATVTLHVGHGTFQPVKVEQVEEHRMHAERFVLPAATAAAVEETRSSGGRIVAVGTTSVRVLEASADADGRLRAGAGTTDLYLYPGRPFRVVDALFTNFHLPRSSLLLLVCAFAGRETVLDLYRQAVERRYRFFSYGDAMLLV